MSLYISSDHLPSLHEWLGWFSKDPGQKFLCSEIELKAIIMQADAIWDGLKERKVIERWAWRHN